MAARATVKATARRQVIPCPRLAEGCTGECATVVLVGRKVIEVAGGQWLVLCTTCRAPRTIGAATAAGLPTLLLTGPVAHEIRQRVKYAALLRSQDALHRAAN